MLFYGFRALGFGPDLRCGEQSFSRLCARDALRKLVDLSRRLLHLPRRRATPRERERRPPRLSTGAERRKWAGQVQGHGRAMASQRRVGAILEALCCCCLPVLPHCGAYGC